MAARDAIFRVDCRDSARTERNMGRALSYSRFPRSILVDFKVEAREVWRELLESSYCLAAGASASLWLNWQGHG